MSADQPVLEAVAASSAAVASLTEMYIAAPGLEKLSIVGENENLGNWKKSLNVFLPITQLDENFFVYYGKVPIPSVPGSAFRFAATFDDGTVIYEGYSPDDHRYDILLPGSIHFFIYKAHNRIWESTMGCFKDNKPIKSSIHWFMVEAFRRASGVARDFDTTVEFLSDLFGKIKSIPCESSSIYWSEIVTAFFENKPGTERFLLLLICSSEMGEFPETLTNFAVNNIKELSLYIHEVFLQNLVERTQHSFVQALKLLISRTEGQFLWILLRINDGTFNFGSINSTDISNSVVTILNTAPQVLCYDEIAVKKLVTFLLKHYHFEIVFIQCFSFVNAKPEYVQLLMSEILEKIYLTTPSYSLSREILLSHFMKQMNELVQEDVPKYSDQLLAILIHLFSLDSRTDMIRLICSTPDYLITKVKVVATDALRNEFLSRDTLQKCDFEYLTEQIFHSNHLDFFPELKQQLRSDLIQRSAVMVSRGEFQDVPSLRLLLLSLNECKIRFLNQASIKDLVQVLSTAPNGFFIFLHQVIGADIDKNLDPYRDQETTAAVDSIKTHLRYVSHLASMINSQNILICDLDCLSDPATIGYFKNLGVTEDSLQAIKENGNRLKRLHHLYTKIFTIFHSYQYVSLLDETVWNRYLEAVNASSSQLDLKAAIELKPPIPEEQAVWIDSVGSCSLFLQHVWHPLLKITIEDRGNQGSLEPSCQQFEILIQRAADLWKKLATTTSLGKLSLDQMKRIISYKDGLNLLSSTHLDKEQIAGLPEIYRDFTTLCNVVNYREQFIPLLSALRYISIADKKPIEDLYKFVQSPELIQSVKITVKQLYDSGIITKLNSHLVEIVTKRPEMKWILEFVNSLATGEHQSSTIKEWLKSRTDKDMEHMSRVLKGNLLEAFEILQTLKRRILTLLEMKFETSQNLFQTLAASEKQFPSEKRLLSNIDMEWLCDMLPKIEGVMQSPMIPTQEDAKFSSSQATMLHESTETPSTSKVEPQNASKKSEDPKKNSSSINSGQTETFSNATKHSPQKENKTSHIAAANLPTLTTLENFSIKDDHPQNSPVSRDSTQTQMLTNSAKCFLEKANEIGNSAAVGSTGFVAEVYVAAPKSSKAFLLIAGEDESLGRWREPKGTFHPVAEISKDLYIYKGKIPVPVNSGSPFKFVLVKGKKMNYEGQDESDNRYDELLPESTYFFIFKITDGFFQGFRNLWSDEKNRALKDAILWFMKEAFLRAEKKAAGELDVNVDYLTDFFNKIKLLRKEAKNINKHWTECAGKLMSEKTDAERCVLLLVCSHVMEILPEMLQKFALDNFEKLSLYIHRALQDNRLKRRQNVVVNAIKMLISDKNNQFSWLLFRCSEASICSQTSGAKNSIFATLKTIPEVLLFNENAVKKIIDCFVNFNNFDNDFNSIYSALKNYPEYVQLLIEELLTKLSVSSKQSWSFTVCQEILKSNFTKTVNELAQKNPNIYSDRFVDFLKHLFKQVKTSDFIKLTCSTPDYLISAVQEVVSELLNSLTLSQYDIHVNDFEFLVKQAFDSDLLGFCPELKTHLRNCLLDQAAAMISRGELQRIPSLKLLMLSLSRCKIAFLNRPSLEDLVEVVSPLPRGFLTSLYNMVSPENERKLRSLRDQEARDIIDTVLLHIDNVRNILDQIDYQDFPVSHSDSLLHAPTVDYLKNVGLATHQFETVLANINRLKKFHRLYTSILTKFQAFGKVLLLDKNEWDVYLTNIHVPSSQLSLKDAMELQPPVPENLAVWINSIESCSTFMDIIWQPLMKKIIQKETNYGNGSDASDDEDVTEIKIHQEFPQLIQQTADGWKELATKVSDGLLTLGEMETNFSSANDLTPLSNNHLDGAQVMGIAEVCQDFTNLSDLRNIIVPFFSALTYFKIKDRKPVDELYQFVREHLLNRWNETTMQQVYQSGLISTLNNDLNIVSNPSETQSILKFVSSLATKRSVEEFGDNQTCPLLDWLRKKTDEDMVAMGRILQGPLLEAYGMLQTLKTRIGPFLDRKFETYKDFLLELAASGEVQTIETQSLTNLLDEIEAAMRAAVISPQEDAKKKLSNANRIVILPKEDGYSIEILPSPSGSLSLEEAQVAYQILEMSGSDENEKNGNDDNQLRRVRNAIPKILALSNVLKKLYATGCMAYNFQRTEIQLTELDEQMDDMKTQLEDWTKQWDSVNNMPYLSYFPRKYLLYLADLAFQNRADQVVSILRIFLHQATEELNNRVIALVRKYRSQNILQTWLSVEALFAFFGNLNEIIMHCHSHRSGSQFKEIHVPAFLLNQEKLLRSYFTGEAIQIFSLNKDLVVPIAVAIHVSFRKVPCNPNHILLAQSCTTPDEITTFMILWAGANSQKDLFTIAHIERLDPNCIRALRDRIAQIVPEKRAPLLLLAQHQHRTYVTKSLGARLGLVSDRYLEGDFNSKQLQQAFSDGLIRVNKTYFVTSRYPGCGKSQQVMRLAFQQSGMDRLYYRIPVRLGTTEELLTGLKELEKLLTNKPKRPLFLHLDVAYSVSSEFNDILFSLFMRGVLFDGQKPKLGYWEIPPDSVLAIELASPFGTREFPLLEYIGEHIVCECNEKTFTYQLAIMPAEMPGYIQMENCTTLIIATKFLNMKSLGAEGIEQWDLMCNSILEDRENILTDPLAEDRSFNLLLGAFQTGENRSIPTFSAINGMATFLYTHLNAMMSSVWFNHRAILFEDDALTRIYKRNVFDLLIKVANDTVSRTWSISTKHENQTEMNWSARQRAILLLGVNELGEISGMNVIGRNQLELEKMFNPKLIPILKLQSIQFQQLNGFSKLIQSNVGERLLINAIRSLLLLDGTKMNFDKVHYLDNQTSESVTDRLKFLFGNTLDYAITGDNLTKMMFALYRIRCGLPVIIFGEAGVGKSALFRFLVETLLGHSFKVCNVNSGTTVEDVFRIVDDGLEEWRTDRSRQIFIFWDEINTADENIIALLKQLMIDRYYNNEMLPENLHFIAAANPYRTLAKTDADASVGLSFRFIGSSDHSGSLREKLVYRVNPLPTSLYEHVYDFGRLCDEAEETYIDEICQNLLNGNTNQSDVKQFSELIKKSHKIAREMSSDPLSAVSLRDATRAATLFHWFSHSNQAQLFRGSISLIGEMSIYLVYAFRFLERKEFLQKVFGKERNPVESIRNVSTRIAEILHLKVQGSSQGIALNDAFCENLFALYVCVLNGIFLIIVGRPGTSKSLSVDILKKIMSSGNHLLRQNLGGLPSVTELYYQCSPLSTSSGFKALFESARKLSQDPKVMMAMIILDELGLADLSPERPIKVLHSELERSAVLTSGEKQKCPYSVVALSNWVVDAAQVNRGILIRRTNPKENDLLEASRDLANSILFKLNKKDAEKIRNQIENHLQMIVDIYCRLDNNPEIGGGHFFSMRDFFYCVKNFVFSVLSNKARHELKKYTLNNQLLKSVIRNFGGHDDAIRSSEECLKDDSHFTCIPKFSPVDLIVDNIKDSDSRLAVQIARHLMLLNRSMVGLQLLNHYVRQKLGSKKLGWNVLFGSCFSGDLEVISVTRKLRQVEQAIRSGGILILCYADQLFESLYMVLNQQYWAQGNFTMTNIALGPSSRSIALPGGFFRIIALQEKEIALNRDIMSPAVLSRFEKRELSCRHLLEDIGNLYLRQVESHLVLLLVKEFHLRRKLIHGFHDDLLPSLALQMQMNPAGQNDDAHSFLDNVFNPMEILKLERQHENDQKLAEYCQRFRDGCIFDDVNDILSQVRSNRIIITTNTMAHLEIPCDRDSMFIRLFEIESEMELRNQLDTVIESGNQNRNDFCLFIQHDAVSRPVEQYQLAKYEVESRFHGCACRIIIIVHVNQRPSAISWTFAFCDEWTYYFVDDIVPSTTWNRLPLSSLMQQIQDSNLSHYVELMDDKIFRSLLLDLLGPILQMKLTCLRSSLGDFLRKIRLAISQLNSSRMIVLLKECLIAQLQHDEVKWNAAEATADENFDSTSSLSEALWNVLKRKLSLPLCHLLIVSDISHIRDESTMELWCHFVETNYSNRLLCVNNSSILQIPTGFHLSTQPFGRLFTMINNEYLEKRCTENQSDPLFSLLKQLSDDNSQYSTQRKEGYFRDWLRLKIPGHLQDCISRLPFQSMNNLMDDLFDNSENFFRDWYDNESGIHSTLELLNIIVPSVQHFTYDRTQIRSWKIFQLTTVRLVFKYLQKISDRDVFCRCVESIEINPELGKIFRETETLSVEWMALRITQRLYLFDKKCQMATLPNLSAQQIIKNLSNLVIESVIRPKMESTVKRSNLESLLEIIGSSSSIEALKKQLCCCRNFIHYLLNISSINREICPSCKENVEDDHFYVPDDQLIREVWDEYQRFLFFFERTAEIFVETANMEEIKNFLKSLFGENTHLRVSWRFMTSIVRHIRKIPEGDGILDSILTTRNCNRNSELTWNFKSFLQALIHCAESDLEEEANASAENQKISLRPLILTDSWNLRRIHRVATLRQLLLQKRDQVTMNFFGEWISWSRNVESNQLSNDLLFFLLRFSCDEGDETKLNNLFKDERIARELDRHNIVGPYMRNLSPFALKFQILPQGKKCSQFDGLVTRNEPMANPKFLFLQEIQPEWAVFIARLACHVADAAEERNWSLFNEMAKNPSVAVNCYLPGISNHMYLEGFEREPFRWYVCSCQALAYVGNCGRPMQDTKCSNCRRVMGNNHVPLPGIRLATADDFRPPMGFYVEQEPLITPTYCVRNASSLVTRCSTLLNSLAMLSGVLENPIPDGEIVKILQTYRAVSLANRDHHEQMLVELLSNHILTDLNVFMELSYKSDLRIQMADKFRIFHLFIHRMMQCASPSLRNDIQLYRQSVTAREQLETCIHSELNNLNELLNELRTNEKEEEETTKRFKQAMEENQTVSWVYETRIVCSRRSIQVILARDSEQSKISFPFLNFILDDHWANLLDALEHLADALRFTSLVRSLLQLKLSREEALQMRISEGLEIMIEEIVKHPSLLDRGRLISTKDQLMELFHGFQQLWNRFSDIENVQGKTFLDYFECQQIDENARPEKTVGEESSLILVLAGCDIPEAAFVHQLLHHAIDAANSIISNDFIKEYCTNPNGSSRLSCSSAGDMANFNPHLYAHTSRNKFNRFLIDHSIDDSTLVLAELYARVSILGSEKHLIHLQLDPLTEFVFKEEFIDGHTTPYLEQRWQIWQPTKIHPEILDGILTDLECNHDLATARTALLSTLHSVGQTVTDPLYVSKMRNQFVVDILKELMAKEIITNQHVSHQLLNCFDNHLKLEVHHVFSLLRAIDGRMRADDIFGGRVPERYRTMLDRRQEQETRETLGKQQESIVDTLLNLVHNIQHNNPPEELLPSKSLLDSVRLLEGDDWNGLPPFVRMEHLGHVLLIAESLE